MMPYFKDDWLAEIDKESAATRARMAEERDRMLREELKAAFNVPDEFMDLAVKIWWRGKED
jgi:hypothetical protein